MKSKKMYSRHCVRLMPFIVICAMLLGAIFVTISTVMADSEPNDSFQTAEEITVGTYEGHLGETDTQDYYKIQLGSGSIVTITFSADSEWDQGLNFYNPIHDHIFDLSSSGTSEVADTYSIPTDIASGYWYIEIGSFSGANSDGDYTFEASIEGGNGGDGDTNGDDTNGDDTSGNGDDTGGGTPGFEAITVLAAVVIALVIWRRKK